MCKSNLWARRWRDILIEQLGGCCRACGTTAKLEFDHIFPVGWTPSKRSWSQRIAEYRRAARDGNLQILCDKCHGRKSSQDGMLLMEETTPDPF